MCTDLSMLTWHVCCFRLRILSDSSTAWTARLYVRPQEDGPSGGSRKDDQSQEAYGHLAEAHRLGLVGVPAPQSEGQCVCWLWTTRLVTIAVQRLLPLVHAECQWVRPPHLSKFSSDFVSECAASSSVGSGSGRRVRGSVGVLPIVPQILWQTIGRCVQWVWEMRVNRRRDGHGDNKPNDS